MSNILETVMLICFGLSWPMSACKSYRARTAKSTSLTFTLLILTGYLAGIGAKIITQNFSYVLVMYFFNLAMVLLNLGIYFRNRKLDMRVPAACRKEFCHEKLHA